MAREWVLNPARSNFWSLGHLNLGGKVLTKYLQACFRGTISLPIIAPVSLIFLGNSGLDSPRESNTKNWRHGYFIRAAAPHKAAKCTKATKPGHTGCDRHGFGPSPGWQRASEKPGLKGAQAAPDNKTTWRWPRSLNYKSLVVSGRQIIFCSPRYQQALEAKPLSSSSSSLPHSRTGNGALSSVASRIVRAITLI